MPDAPFELWFLITGPAIPNHDVEVLLWGQHDGKTYLPLFTTPEAIDSFVRGNSIFAPTAGHIRSLADYDTLLGKLHDESGMPIEYVVLDPPPKSICTNPLNRSDFRQRLAQAIDSQN